MRFCDKYRFNKYINLAKKLADTWEAESQNTQQENINKVLKYQKKILKKLKWLAKKTGNTNEYEALKQSYEQK